MKYLKILIFVLFIFVSTIAVVGVNKAYAADPFIPNCLGIEGKFYANKTWKGGYIEVGCAGDDGGAVNQNPARWCKGEVKRVYPGKPFRLTKCSCFDKEGCLKIGKNLTRSSTLNSSRRYTITVNKRIQDMPEFKNNGCVINKIGKMCGSNGQIIKPRIKITCDVPPKTKTPTPTGQVCPIPDKVKNVKITCPNCEPSTDTEVNTSLTSEESDAQGGTDSETVTSPTPVEASPTLSTEDLTTTPTVEAAN